MVVADAGSGGEALDQLAAGDLRAHRPHARQQRPAQARLTSRTQAAVVAVREGMLPAEPRPRGSTSEVIDRRRPAGHARTLLITEDEEGEMTAYAVAILRDVEMGAEVVRYLERIDATLAPFGGRFVVHGAEPVALEGTWEGTLIVIGFPDAERARGWYDSAA